MADIPILVGTTEVNSRGSRDSFEKMLTAPTQSLVTVSSNNLLAQVSQITSSLELGLEAGELDSASFYVDEISISLGVSAEGKLGLVALGQVGAAGNASLKVVLKRKLKDT